MADFYINNHTECVVLHAFSFYQFGEQLGQKLYDRLGEFNMTIRRGFLPFVNKKVAKVSDDRRWTEQLYLKHAIV